jgi:uncharacterized protein
MNSRAVIDYFLNGKKMAIAGVSRNPRKFGNLVFRIFREQGYEIFPVNPNASTIDEVTCISSVSLLPPEIENLLIITEKKQTEKIVIEAIQQGIKNIWIQDGCETDEAIEVARRNNVHLVANACILMYAHPVGFHKFHMMVARLFGKYIYNS